MPEEKQLIQPLQVERDEYGFWTHPLGQTTATNAHFRSAGSVTKAWSTA